MSVKKTLGMSLFTLIAVFLAAWAGAPRYVIKPMQTIYETPSSIQLDADPTRLNPPADQ